MSDAIIVLNAGSSSLKFSIYSVVDHELHIVNRGLIEGLGTSPRFKARDQHGKVIADTSPKSSDPSFGHPQALAHLVQWMRETHGEKMTVVAVGHRMAHGGAAFNEPALIDDGVVAKLERLIPLVPLHQPHNLAAIKAVSRLRPDLPQVACFDTAFHQGRQRVTERMGLPDEMFQRGMRRWGFHGLSYEFIAEQFHEKAPAIAEGRVIAAHLGSGASLCAMKNGRSVDTTMGFSALDGLPMGTRCGSLDPGVILLLLREGWTVDRIEELLYKKSGLLGISNVSNDVRDLLGSDRPLAAEAIEFFVYRIVREIGSLVAALGGLDALIFTAGVGENSPIIRQRVCEKLAWLGIAIDADANQRGRECISPTGQSPSVWVIPTDEERVIASHTIAVIRGRANRAKAMEPSLA